MTESTSDHIIAFDIETTGLEPTEHAIIEIGALHLASGAKFEAKIRHQDVRVQPAAMRVNKVDVSALDSVDRKPLGQVDHEFEQWLLGLKADSPGRFIVLGYNVGAFDILFAKAQMPKSAKLFHYRSIDLNSILMAEDARENHANTSFMFGLNKKLIREMNPNPLAHTALADALMAAEDFRILTGWRKPVAQFATQTEPITA